jgi:hypothetical protein
MQRQHEAAPLVALFDEWAPRTSKGLSRWGLRPSFPGLSQNAQRDEKGHADLDPEI